MFGYVRIFQDELKVAQARKYKRYYCGLCRQLADYSTPVRMLLSYDMVFLVLLSECSMPEEKANRLRHSNCLKRINADERLKYIAAVSVMLIYYKCQNDYYDGDNKKKMVMTAIKSGYQKAKRDYPEVDIIIAEQMNKLYQYEKENSTDFEALDDCFADIFYKIFTTRYMSDEYDEVRGRISKHVGAWVYWFDMLVDYDDDKKHGDYNALVLSDNAASRQKIMSYLNYHLSEADRLINILPYTDNIEIVRNVIQFGLPYQMKQVERLDAVL